MPATAAPRPRRFPEHRARFAKRAGLCLAAAAFLSLAGCLDLATSVAFPPTISGLDRTQPWVALPVRSWVLEGELEPRAVMACFAPSCAPQAAVGLFRARGEEAEQLARAVQDPARVARLVAEPRPTARPGARPKPRVAASTEPLSAGEWRGFTLNLRREDGSRDAHMAVLTRGAGNLLSVLVVVSPSAEAAQRLARDIAAREG